MRRIAALLADTVRPMELAIVCEIFGGDRTSVGAPPFEMVVVSGRPSTETASLCGLRMRSEVHLSAVAEADVVVLAPPLAPQLRLDPAAAEAVMAAVANGARVVGASTSVFALGSLGLLDGRRAVTHWAYAEALQERFPAAAVDASTLYSDDDPVFTSAGGAAVIDMCLHMVRKDHGAAAANTIARRMVVAPYRSPNQAQVVETTVPDTTRDDRIDGLLSWALQNLHADLSIEAMARRTYLSRRSLARRFRATTGTTPYAWVVEQRLRLAQQLLEERPDLTVEDIAFHTGFSSSGMLRQHFGRKYGIAPSEYRHRHRRDVLTVVS